MAFYPVKLYEDELNHICALLYYDPNPRSKMLYEKLKKKLERLKAANVVRSKHDDTNRRQEESRYNARSSTGNTER